MKHLVKLLILSLIFNITSCDNPNSNNKNIIIEKSIEQLPYFTYQKESLFPGDGSLLRAEDGVYLEDGRIIVVDQAKGLRLIESDGSNRPFGDFASAGFVHNPPNQVAGPNGVVLDQDGKHVLMSDVADGKIYRVNVATEDVEMIYDHPFGVNTIYSDKTGAIWFSQSAESLNLSEMFQAANLPVPTGAVFRMANLESPPVKIMDSLYFANGITMDKDEKHLYVAETMMNRVHAFEVDTKSGSTNYLGIATNVGSPDNILIDQKGRLIVASPLYNQVVAVDFENHSQHIIFDGSSSENLKISNEWNRRSNLGMERLELLSPNLFSPLPGLLTGMFFSTDGQTLYISNLGNDLLKYKF
ncbi:SMP-30/gluconolactonase/LRE family protein [Formosa maritima]|uniref:Beta-propeller fold lactonase family protein n=1 Tax=Formosa maritima TaxID=2592046 RepID=A0A5D0GEZ8_9FLAO|nr:SMP-30/gluconolactonase/LRE family protein [Formosa maritima]TYA57496.1 beta-propeller fold lactonase family protein [Formosa maritima]